MSPDEEIDKPDDTDNSLITVNSPSPPVLVVADDVPDVVPGDVEVVPRQRIFSVPNPGQNVAGVQGMNDEIAEGTTTASPPLRRSDRVRRRVKATRFFVTVTPIIFHSRQLIWPRELHSFKGYWHCSLLRVKFDFEKLII